MKKGIYFLVIPLYEQIKYHGATAGLLGAPLAAGHNTALLRERSDRRLHTDDHLLVEFEIFNESLYPTRPHNTN